MSRFSPILCFIALCIAIVNAYSISAASPNCVYSFHNGDSIDFSQVGTLTGTWHDMPAYLNLCQNIPDKCANPGDSSICSPKATMGSDDQSFASKSEGAKPSTNNWDDATKQYVIIETSGKAQCWATSGFISRTTTINVMCADSNDTAFTIQDGTGTCSVFVNLKLQCGRSGLSGGGIFLIIIFSLFAAYFIIGFLVCKFVMQKDGLDAIPQRGFWCALPGLYLAGCRTVIGKVTGKKSGSNGYEDPGAGGVGDV